MANLAIKGHATRGREVIELLEMLGGKNKFNLRGNEDEWFVLNEPLIQRTDRLFAEKSFTLYEFLEKFPYKVGDEVTHNSEILMTVAHMYWDAECNVIRYDIQSPVDNNYKVKAMLSEHLRPYKEETMEEKDEKSANHVYNTEIISFDIAQRDKYELDLQGKFHVVLREGKYYVERIKPKYPKTYEECCEVLDIDVSRTIGHSADCPFFRDVTCYEDNLISSLAHFRKLLICRDAYWKIAGAEMGLGKSWEYDMSKDKFSYAISYQYGYIQKNEIRHKNAIFVFPTKEMRDAFKENFDKDLEFCKELL